MVVNLVLNGMLGGDARLLKKYRSAQAVGFLVGVNLVAQAVEFVQTQRVRADI